MSVYYDVLCALTDCCFWCAYIILTLIRCFTVYGLYFYYFTCCLEANKRVYCIPWDPDKTPLRQKSPTTIGNDLEPSSLILYVRSTSFAIMFSPASVCVSVCLSVCLFACLLT